MLCIAYQGGVIRSMHDIGETLKLLTFREEPVGVGDDKLNQATDCPARHHIRPVGETGKLNYDCVPQNRK